METDTIKVLRFKKLVPDTSYYINSILLYEDANNILWCDDNFANKKRKKHNCDDYDMEVVKRFNKLVFIKVPKRVEVHHNVLDKWACEHWGPGKQKFIQRKIPFHNKLPSRNRSYNLSDLPIGFGGWITDWAVLTCDDNGEYKANSVLKINVNTSVSATWGGTRTIYVQKDSQSDINLDYDVFSRHMPEVQKWYHRNPESLRKGLLLRSFLAKLKRGCFHSFLDEELKLIGMDVVANCLFHNRHIRKIICEYVESVQGPSLPVS